MLDTSSLVGPNLFAYCRNNPVNRIDTTGHFWEEVWDWIVDAAGAMWDAYQRSYERQQEAQLLNAQMTLVHGPRIFNAGMKAGIANACGSWSVGKLSNHQNSQNNNQPSDGNSVLYAFIGGFITGVVLEIFDIIQENIPEGMD